MDEQPVALQGRHQRSDLAVYPKRGVSQEEGREQRHHGPQVALEGAPKGEQAQGRQTPGKKDQGLVEVGQRHLNNDELEFVGERRRRSVARRLLIRFYPAAEQRPGLNPQSQPQPDPACGLEPGR